MGRGACGALGWWSGQCDAGCSALIPSLCRPPSRATALPTGPGPPRRHASRKQRPLSLCGWWCSWRGGGGGGGLVSASETLETNRKARRGRAQAAAPEPPLCSKVHPPPQPHPTPGPFPPSAHPLHLAFSPPATGPMLAACTRRARGTGGAPPTPPTAVRRSTPPRTMKRSCLLLVLLLLALLALAMAAPPPAADVGSSSGSGSAARKRAAALASSSSKVRNRYCKRSPCQCNPPHLVLSSPKPTEEEGQ